MENCAATLDLSNLNINDFQFFRYQQRLPNGELKPVPAPSPLTIGNHFQRAKAGKFMIFRILSVQFKKNFSFFVVIDDFFFQLVHLYNGFYSAIQEMMPNQCH